MRFTRGDDDCSGFVHNENVVASISILLSHMAGILSTVALYCANCDMPCCCVVSCSGAACGCEVMLCGCGRVDVPTDLFKSCDDQMPEMH